MQAIGDTLREARMRQRIDMSEVETATKIRAKYLRALENEEFELLPGSTLVKSFLRTYAEFLDLDAHLLVEEYHAQHEPRAEADAQPFTPQGASSRRDRRHGRGGGPRLGAALAAVVVTILVLFLVVGLFSDDKRDRGSGAGGSRQATQTPTSETGRSAQAPSEPRAGRQKRGSSAAQQEGRGARAVSLRVAPDEDTYVCIDNGRGRVLFEGTLSAPRTFRARRLRINLGKTSASLRVNGRRIVVEQGPDPVGFDFKPDGREDIADEAKRPCA